MYLYVLIERKSTKIISFVLKLALNFRLVIGIIVQLYTWCTTRKKCALNFEGQESTYAHCIRYIATSYGG